MSNRISRRNFLRGSAMGAVAVGLPIVPMAYAQEKNPTKGGQMTVGLREAAVTDSLDPATFLSLIVQVGITHGVYNNLVEVDANSEPIPELAAGWEASPDAKIWTFELRPDVEFHNGKTLDAHDVVASINHHRGENSGSGAQSLVKQIVDIRVDGDQVVSFELSEGNADFPYLLNDYHLVVMPSEEGKPNWKDGVGTGGYRLKEFVPGERISLVRQNNYWKEGRAHIDEVELLSIQDPVARLNALLTGEVDVIDSVDLSIVDKLAAYENLAVDEVAGTDAIHFRCVQIPHRLIIMTYV